MSRFGTSAKGGFSSARSVAVGVSLAALAACVPSLGEKPQLNAPEAYTASRSFDAPAAAWPADGWWRGYGDAQLTALIEEGLKDSPSLAAASARVRQAEAYVRGAGAANMPQVGAEASAQSARQSLNQGFPDAFKSFLPHGWNEQARAAVSVDQQLDFFGRNRAAIAAARSQAEAAAMEEAAARLQLSTAIALGYANLSRLSADHAAAQSTVELRQHSADLVRQRLTAGLENQGRASQADSELSAARADLTAVDAELAQSRNAIAALLGKGPDRGLDIAAPADPTLTAPGLPANLAADLIGRRPDIAAARARAEAAAARIREARAEFYPNINLSAVLGQQSLGLDLFAQGDSRFGSIGPAISLPIFTGGRLEGNYRGARASYDEAAANYNQTLADALRQVADALTAKRAVAQQLVDTRAALMSAEDAYRVARERYEGGLSNYIEVLTVENSLVTRRRALADLEARAFAVDVELVRALGGGFSSET